MNLNNISNFLKEDSGYIIVVDRHGQISDAQRFSFFTLLGRAFAWLTGHSYDLKKVVETVRSSSAFQAQDNKQVLQFITKLSKKIENYNLKHPKNRLEKIDDLFNSLNTASSDQPSTNRTKSSENLPDALRSTQTTNLGKADSNKTLTASTFENGSSSQEQDKQIIGGQNQRFPNNFEERQVQAKERYKARKLEGVKFSFTKQNDSISPEFLEDENVLIASICCRSYIYSGEKNFLMNLNVNVPPIFHIFAFSTHLQIPFFHLDLLIGGDRHRGSSNALSGNMDIATATIATVISRHQNSQFPSLLESENQLLIEACKFLTYASAAVNPPEPCELSLESLFKIMALIDKITDLIEKGGLRENEPSKKFFEFATIMKEVLEAVPKDIKSARKV